MPISSDSVECIAMPAIGSDPLGAVVSAQPSKLPEPSSPSDPAEKASVAPTGDEFVVERKPSVKVSEDRPVAVPRSPVESIAEVSEEGGLVDEVHSSEDDGEEAAKSLKHSLNYYPKSRHCEVCQRAKMTSRYHPRRGDPDEEETPPLHFGRQMRVDHIIIESLVVICQKGPRVNKPASFVLMSIAVVIKPLPKHPEAPQIM